MLPCSPAHPSASSIGKMRADLESSVSACSSKIPWSRACEKNDLPACKLHSAIRLFFRGTAVRAARMLDTR
ncbi:MAG: hypothetical protein ACTSVE_01605 [Candidatus Helarchaeota archaeon]